MRSVAPEDATARARIRDSAVEEFGSEGFHRTTVRAIAARAGVSAPLVVHHFGSKEGLRRACDEHVLAVIWEGKQAALSDGPPSLQAYLALVDDAVPLLRYLTRVLQEGSEASLRLVTGMVDDAEAYLAAAQEAGTVRPTADRRARAALLVAWGLADLLLGPVIASALGSPDDEVAAMGRLAVPAVEIYTSGLFTDDRFLRAVTGAGLAGEQEEEPR